MYCSKSMLAGPREFQATTLAFQASFISLLFASRRSPSTVSMIYLSRNKTQVEQIKANEYY